MRCSFSSVVGSQSGLDSDNHRDSHPSRADEVVCDHEKERNEQQGHGACHSPAAMDSRSAFGPDISG